ncbi:bifunctional diaminohydroxyphosphoribosylaminopyrimidine deaminase/5-amino-6-(5-phosphoribosylamino)uracil reductase RibD [Micromonospora sp. SH-82]|uniref:bifunctional diaminohydroxyphosphoribosylaminopyrimidine deaminase/5-amino-6-(5-phosphoribosylamino)uracil reductase RibD n=1 Tax=Micromonospora sp. SH-82 TaxID=3132938 RepID=UPI003EBCFFCB
MRQAIMLSSLGLGTASPNPPVGCVILDQAGVVVGVGFHRRKGEPHAEVNALVMAGAAARGGTAVVTLEPCNHVGVTPACRQELLDAGVVRVVISVLDPTSRGDGGAAVLAAAGIDVETDVLPAETLTVLGPWLTATRRSWPYVTWAYSISDESRHKPEEQLTADLRDHVDIVVVDALPEEGVLDGHARAHFLLPEPLDVDLRNWLSEAYAAGSRNVLFSGSSSASVLRHNIDRVDEVVIHLPIAMAEPVARPVRLDLLPAGFELRDISYQKHSMRLRFNRAA